MADASNVKTVNVQVETGSTEHALLTGAKKTRRRRNANSTPPTPSSAPVIPVASESSPLPDNTKNAVKITKADAPAPLLLPLSPKAPEPAPVALGPPQAPQTPPVPASLPAPVIKIAPKNGRIPPTPAPRILPKKRIGMAPTAETLKQKPKFIVEPASVVEASGHAGVEDSQRGGTFVPESPTSGNNRSPAGVIGGARSKTRRAFKERRIHLTVQPIKKSRKYRRTLRARVAEMPLQQVRRLLLRKGVLKPKTGADMEKAPPEEMMRSMLVDYMMLHHAD